MEKHCLHVAALGLGVPTLAYHHPLVRQHASGVRHDEEAELRRLESGPSTDQSPAQTAETPRLTNHPSNTHRQAHQR